MLLELFIVVTFMAFAQAGFGHFEERTPPWRRMLKVAIAIGLVAGLSAVFDRTVALAVFGAWVIFGFSFHLWWTRKHGINPWTAQPRDRYYELRGWR